MEMSSAQSQQTTAGRSGFDEYGYRPLKASVIREIQIQCGEEPCYSTDKRYDCEQQCEWRRDCVKLRAVWLR